MLLLGRDHGGPYGEYVCERLADGRTACTLSVGRDPESPAHQFKGDHPNEDGLLALDEGRTCVLAVTDAHHGADSGHRLLTLLDAAFTRRPPLMPAHLQRAVESLHDPDADPVSESASTLLVAVFHRELREGFGVSFGDSTLAVVGAGRPPRLVNRKTPRFVTAAHPETLGPESACPFHFSAGPDELILAFTDGVDECCYRQPHRSIGPRHLADLLARTGPDPEAYARALTELALEGVDGHPGGQDNIALIVSRAG